MLRSDHLHCAISGAHAVARAVVDAGLALVPPYDTLARIGMVAELDTGCTGGGTNLAPSSGSSTAAPVYLH